MYATGIGLVLYGIEEAESLANPDEEQEEAAAAQGAAGFKTIDLFANMDDDLKPHEEPVAEAEEEPEEEKKPKKVKKPKKGLFDRTIGGFLDKVFSEDGIDD
jgi:hypothetical protein